MTTSTPDTEQAQDKEEPSQATFKATPYQDAAWEVVGKRLEYTEFEPMHMDVVDRGERAADPMFANYGGITEPDVTKRWHLPEHLSIQTPAQKEARRQAEAEERRKIVMFPEELAEREQKKFEEGRQQGMLEAVEHNSQNIQEIEGRFKAIFSDLRGQFQERLLALERIALNLSLELARRVIHTHVDIHPEYIMEIIKEALSKSAGAAVSRVRVSPEDYEFIEVLGLEKSLRQDDQSWQLVKDETIKTGCIIETSAGEIDFQLDKAWQRIAEQIFKR